MRPVRNLAYLAVFSALAMVVGACTPALEPAKPDDFQQLQPSPQEQEKQENAGLNPLETGLRRIWEAEFSTAPLAVTFAEKNDDVVVLTKDSGKQTLVALARVGESAVLEKWTYTVPSGKIENLVAHDGIVYFNVIGSAAEGAQTDLVALELRDGKEKFRWSKLNPLDSQAPTIIGSYLRGLGVFKIEQQRMTAAILDADGKVVASEKFFQQDFALPKTAGESTDADMGDAQGETEKQSAEESRTQIFQFRRNQVILPQNSPADQQQILAFPMMRMLPADWCEIGEKGAVCVDLAKQELSSYDLNGDPIKTLPLQKDAPAMRYRFVGAFPEIQFTQLMQKLAVLKAGAESEMPENKGGVSAGAEESAGHGKTKLLDAYLYGDTWLGRDTWRGVRPGGACRPVSAQAPFCLAQGRLVNVRTGEVLDPSFGKIIVGTGAASDTFFSYRDGVFAMLGAQSVHGSEKEK
ncbi:hypothetical protein [Arcanobacterium hippocoleae]|uniref:Lipoprotein n=1 Tax=Arcanobacterium hippocoleae TaxID=149017 RepID=A0ABU1T2L4_9ACTO|nr:hypothetical protein [Arcanobacterium hippocoleae]MDR6939606.1 hypothetical protein [Arcanobacterium hippocoleae]